MRMIFAAPLVMGVAVVLAACETPRSTTTMTTPATPPAPAQIDPATGTLPPPAPATPAAPPIAAPSAPPPAVETIRPIDPFAPGAEPLP